MLNKYYPTDPIVQNLIASALLDGWSIPDLFASKLVWTIVFEACDPANMVVGDRVRFLAARAVAVDSFWLNGPSGVVVIAVFVLMGLAGYLIIEPFGRAGIYAAYTKTTSGIDFDKSLRMQSRLDFLGVGADKLTKSPEFEKALIRASRAGAPVRLLLSQPDNPILSRSQPELLLTRRNTRSESVKASSVLLILSTQRIQHHRQILFVSDSA